MKIMTKGRCSRQGTLLKDVSAEELAGIYTEVAEEIRIDNAYILFKHFRGQQLTCPLKFYSGDYIARRICIEHGEGGECKKTGNKIRDIRKAG